MEVDCIPFKDTAYFSPIVLDYLAGSESLKDFYQHPPHFDSFEKLIEERTFKAENRLILSKAIKDQYQGSIKLKVDDATAVNIKSLEEEQTYTITTGHQLNLFTGPLYFIYKIVSAINLAKRLSKKYPSKKFVPVYWMASEDHDFEEISFFRFQGKKLQWKTNQTGAVGRMNPRELDSVLAEFETLLTPYTNNGTQLKKWFKKAYLEHETLADATRYLAHTLFAEEGLVVVDGDDTALKRIMIPIFEAELKQEVSSEKVEQQNKALAKHYKVQANPRAINLFYLTDDSRKRIARNGENYKLIDSDQEFTEVELMQELQDHPERFSPNVLLRPLYQEVILPNLAYIGGGGELAYWFELSSTFKHFKVPFPMLLLRNSVMWMQEKEAKYAKELGLNLKQLFQKEGVLLKEWVKNNAKEELTLQAEQEAFEELYQKLAIKSKRIDGSLGPHVAALAKAEEKKLKQLSEKLIRAERKKQNVAAERIAFLKQSLFPNDSLQERYQNFSDFYLAYGDHFIELLLDHLSLPTQDFTVIK